MTPPRRFSPLPLPPVENGRIVCVGVLLGGDPSDWIAAATPFATAGEIARANRFVHALDAARHLVGRALARRVLSAALACPLGDFPPGPWGKPGIAGASPSGAPAIDFSITHSGDIVLAAFCREAAVGVDVELSRPLPDILDLASQLHPCESAAIRALPPAERVADFYRCWTRKEAVLKALGRGLSLPLDCFVTRSGPPASDWLTVPPDGVAPGSLWTTLDVDTGPGRQCAVAATAAGLGLDVFLD